jgi:hypothetical protein
MSIPVQDRTPRERDTERERRLTGRQTKPETESETHRPTDRQRKRGRAVQDNVMLKPITAAPGDQAKERGLRGWGWLRALRRERDAGVETLQVRAGAEVPQDRWGVLCDVFHKTREVS